MSGFAKHVPEYDGKGLSHVGPESDCVCPFAKFSVGVASDTQTREITFYIGQNDRYPVT